MPLRKECRRLEVKSAVELKYIPAHPTHCLYLRTGGSGAVVGAAVMPRASLTSIPRYYKHGGKDTCSLEPPLIGTVHA
jgi:hypothetical protein